jgi:Fic family protein
VSQKTVKKLNFIHECKGKQDLFVIDKPEVLKTLLRVAMINSTVSSNAIENIVVSEKKVKALIEKRVKPKNRDEEEALGYKDVLHTIHESYEHIPVKPNYILQFHRDLFAHVKVGGNYGK